MHWLCLLAVALGLTLWGRSVRPAEEIYSLALYSAGLLSGLWGIALTPSPVLIALGIGAIGWLQIRTT